MDNLNLRIHPLHTEAAGLLTCQVVRFSDVPALLLNVARGDVRAAQTLRTLDQFLTNVERAKPQEPTLCATCDRSVQQSSFACAIVSADRDDATQALVFAICFHCAGTGSLASIKARIEDFLRENIWPELRVINPAPHGGRA